MGSFCGSFGKSQTTETTQQQQQSGQTTSNFMPQLQQAYSTLQNQYSGLGNMGANPWQTGAADAQAGVASNLQPAYGAAGNVATSGIGDVSRYMSPYISNVVDATRTDFAAQNARDLSSVNAQAARSGALTGTGAAAARNQAMESQRRTQDATIANLYNQGFQQSGQLATADANARLSGAAGIGSLVGANTGANAAAGNIGQQVQQSNLSPYTLANQYAAGTAGLAGAAGSSYTGTSSGTSSSNQQQSPGAGTVASGLIGTGLMLLKDGGRVDDGPSISDRYHKTLADLHVLHKSLGGGTGTDGYSTLGDFVHPSQNDPGIGNSWAAGTTVTPEKADMSKYVDAAAHFAGLQKKDDTPFSPVNVQWMPMMQPRMADGGRLPHFSTRGRVTDDLTAFVDPNDNDPGTERTTSVQPRPTVGVPYEAPTETFTAPRMDLGGPQQQSSNRPGDYLRQWLPGLNEGVWKGQAPTGTQRLGAALTQIGWGNPFANVGKSTFDQFNSEDQRRMQRDQFAKQLQMQAQQALGTINGQKTLQALQQEETARHNRAVEEQGKWSIDAQRGVAFNTRTMETKQLDDETKRRAEQARSVGMDPNSSEFKQFVLTGKMGNDALSPAAQKQILEADEVIRAGQGARESLNAALTLNNNTYQGAGASQLGWITSQFGDKKGIDTLDLNNLMMTRVLESLKATFGGNPTEGERKILLDVSGAINAPAENRKRILERALDAVNKREEYNKAQIEALKNKTYFKPSQPGTGVNGPAGGERTDKPVTDRLPTQEKGPPGTKGNPVYPRSPQDAANLPAGTFYMTPDGREMVR